MERNNVKNRSKSSDGRLFRLSKNKSITNTAMKDGARMTRAALFAFYRHNEGTDKTP